MPDTIHQTTPTRQRRLARAAVVPLLVWLIAVGAWAVRHDPTLEEPGARLGSGVADLIPVELGPATVVTP